MVRSQESVAQQEYVRTLENRLDNQERMIKMLGNCSSNRNSGDNEEQAPEDVDSSDLMEENGTYEIIIVITNNFTTSSHLLNDKRNLFRLWLAMQWK